jgi:glutamyl/glutaminyl-tRNA synthetase
MDSIGDFVVSRSDGSVTYLMAVVADDHDSRVTHVIRGEEHLSNVPKQELIYKALGWEVPEWVHIPMILDENRHKLSKRSGAISIGQYRELGWAHGAVTSYLATLSWSLAPADRILTPDELAEIFDLDSVALVSPVHDEARMRHFGRVYMAGLSHEELLEECRDFFGARQDPELPDSEKISLIRELAAVCFTVRELGKQIETELAYRDCPATEKIPEWFGGFLEFLNSVPDADWRSEKLKSSMKIFQSKRGLKGKDFFHPVRILLTGMPQGAPIGIILSCIGKNEALRRLGNRRL